MKTLITDSEIEKSLLMAKHGMPVLAIAQVLDRSTPSVYRILKAFGVASTVARRTPQQSNRAFAQMRAGMGLHMKNQIAEVLPPTPKIENAPGAIIDDVRVLGNTCPDAEPEGVARPNGYRTPAIAVPQAIGEPLDFVESVCKECGATFRLTVDHVDWFASRGMIAPKRCESCREARKLMHDGGGITIAPDEIAAMRARLSELESALERRRWDDQL